MYSKFLMALLFLGLVSNLYSKNLTPEEVKEWEKAGINDSFWWNNKKIGLDEAKKWKELGMDLQKASRYIEYGINPIEFVEWKKEGLEREMIGWIGLNQTIDNAKKWKKSFDINEAKKWIEYAIKDPQNALAWKELDIEPWKASQIELQYKIDGNEAKDWLKVGIEFKDTEKWKAQGINPFEAKAIIEKEESEKLAKEEIWGKEGINDYYVIKAWEEAGITDPKTARKLLDVEVDDREYSSWLRIGINDIDTIIKWCKLNKKSEDIHYLKTWAGIYTPEEYSSWESLGVNLNDIIKIKETGIKTPDQFKEWVYYFDKDNKNYGYNIQALKEVGIDEPSKLKKWREHEIYQNDIPYFIRAGLDDPSEAKKWIALINNLPIIERVIKSGFKTVKDYEPYKEMDYYNASILYSFNIKPDNLTKSMDKIEKKFSNVMRLSSGKSFFSTKEDFLNVYNSVKKDCDEINYTKVFLEEEISNNKGKCYVFMGSMNQRDDKKPFLGDKKQNGVVTIEQNYFTTIGGIKQFAFYVEDFKGNWQENGHKVGIIKGTGSTEFNVKGLGEIKIPSGKVIHIF